MKTTYHLGFDDACGAKYVILPGDPGRVQAIAEFLDNPRFLCQNREYTTWIGEINTQPVLVMSTGMGGPSTAIAVEELSTLGIETYVRVGTCGGMADFVESGDVVIATGAIRQEGTTREYVPIEFPAIADLAVTNALVQAAGNIGAKYHTGVVQCKDSFYGQHSPDRMPVGYDLKDKWQAWIKAGCLASEMESATLYIVAGVLGLRAGCVLSVVWNQERQLKGLSNKEAHDTTLAIKTAVEAVRLMISGGGKCC
ncbi:MAG: uridine phosphorylase [Oscillospiraceae bacterium]|nr:uridine phosphorylase [Oscillospiraceae bacterium]